MNPGAAVPDAPLVRRLLRRQVPRFADLPVRPSPSSGSSNWVFRLGEELAVRLPRSEAHVADLQKEMRWLPHLAGQLSLPVPELRFSGVPSEEFARPWALVSWLPGDAPGALAVGSQRLTAVGMGRFVRQLHAVDPAGQPAGSEHWGYRAGEPVTDQIDDWADQVADALADLFDPAAVREAWRRLRDVPPASTSPCWIHTDLSAENLLVDGSGRLTGIIDFGGIGVGDRAVDLLYAWSLFDAPARAILRAEAGADEATWLRARAWAFVGPGLLSIHSYRHTMRQRTARLVRMVEAVAAEVGVSLRA